MNKKLFNRITAMVILAFTISCSTSDDTGSSSDYDKPCGKHNGKQLYKGPKGGCYYYNSNSNKTYVDRSECNC